MSNLNLAVYILTNRKRPEYLERTIKSVCDSDQGPFFKLLVEKDLFQEHGVNYEHLHASVRSSHAHRFMIQKYVNSGFDYGLFLEDDVEVGLHIRHNVESMLIWCEHFEVSPFVTLWNKGFPQQRVLNAKPLIYITDPKNTHGTLATAMRHDIAEAMLASYRTKFRREHWMPQDIHMYNTFSPVTHDRSFVEHIGDVSSIAPERGVIRAGNFEKEYKI